MSELKDYDIMDIEAMDDERLEKSESGKIQVTRVYIKSDADKVIAELKDKLQAANEQIENLINSASRIMLFQDRVKDDKCAELRHSNYKRCLAMARYCEMSKRCYGHMLIYGRVDFYKKRHKRWLELAKKFKEVK